MRDIGAFGTGGFGSSPYGSALTPFYVSEAIPLGPNSVQVVFSTLLDTGYGPLLSPSNYDITPSLGVSAVQVFSGNSVRLTTATQAATIYTVEVTTARSYLGQSLVSPRSAAFEGIAGFLTFGSAGTERRRVRLIFSGQMREDAALTTPSNYALTDVMGGILPILEVVAETSPPYAVDLVLGADLQPAQFYVVQIDPMVRGAGGEAISPAKTLFQFIETAPQAGLQALTIPFSAFSGEVSEHPMLGSPDGLLFFSPALEASAANSVIQVDEVSVCTRAYDEYHFPEPPDPKVLYTFGGGHAEGLGAGFALWAPFPRLVEARFELEQHVSEAMPQAVDSHCIATFQEPWDHTLVALVNNTAWKVFDNGPVPPAYFITASNLAPIPPGPTVVRVLQP